MLRPTRTTTIVAAVMAGLVASAAPAWADEEAAPAIEPSTDGETPVAPIPMRDVSPKVEQEEHWYGWQVVAADAAAILGTIGCASAADSEACLIPYLIAAPTVHLAHNRPMHALGSVGLRLGLPLAGAMVAAQFVSCRPDEWLCGLSEMAVGVLVGTVAASIVDATALSTEQRAVAASPSRLSFLSPSVSAGPNGASFGLRGSF